jgi:hypothetical protein
MFLGGPEILTVSGNEMSATWFDVSWEKLDEITNFIEGLLGPPDTIH